MYFEDEKENMADTGALDDLDLDIESGDDKTVTWDDLLNDDADIDLGSVKKNDTLNDEALLDSSDEDMALLNDDDVVDIRPSAAPRKAQRKDAFDVFGGSSVPESGDTITPDLTHRPSARTKAAIDNGDDDDDIYFAPRKNKKSSGILPALVGVLVAALIVGGGLYVFMTYGKNVAGLDAGSLLTGGGQETPTIPDVNPDKPTIDINAPAETNAQKTADNTQAKKEEEKLVTFSIQNGGRINPFVPPTGFEASKYSVVSNYEILSPPEEIPSDDTAEEAKKLMNITVSGILFDSSKPSAIVNVNGSDFYVQIGDKVDDFQVVAINTQYVAIKDGTNIYKAQVGENFGSKNVVVGGMASRQSSGAKQYTSSSDVEVSVK